MLSKFVETFFSCRKDKPGAGRPAGSAAVGAGSSLRRQGVPPPACAPLPAPPGRLRLRCAPAGSGTRGRATGKERRPRSVEPSRVRGPPPALRSRSGVAGQPAAPRLRSTPRRLRPTPGPGFAGPVPAPPARSAGRAGSRLRGSWSQARSARLAGPAAAGRSRAWPPARGPDQGAASSNRGSASHAGGEHTFPFLSSTRPRRAFQAGRCRPMGLPPRPRLALYPLGGRPRAARCRRPPAAWPEIRAARGLQRQRPGSRCRRVPGRVPAADPVSLAGRPGSAARAKSWRPPGRAAGRFPATPAAANYRQRSQGPGIGIMLTG